MTKSLRIKNKIPNTTFSKIRRSFVNGASKLGDQRHLAALRDSFALFTPLIIIGSLAVVIRTFVFGASGMAMNSLLGWIAKSAGQIHMIHQEAVGEKVSTATWVLLGNFSVASNIGNWAFFSIESATYGAMTLYFSFGIGYFIARSRDNDAPIICGFATMAAVLAANCSLGAKPVYIDSSGIMSGIIVGFISSEIFCLLSNSKMLLIKLPTGVPSSVAKSFAKLLPILVLMIGIAVIQAIFFSLGFAIKSLAIHSKVSHYGDYLMSIGDAIYHGIQSPFLETASNKNADLGLGLVYTFSLSFLWFFGIHGSNIMNGIFNTVFMLFLSQNLHSNDIHYHPQHNTHVFVQGTFDAFVFLGGTGATLGWIISTFLFSKKKSDKEIAKFASPSSIFNINEPVVFGTPMIVNPIMLVPYIFITPILSLVTYVSIFTGMVPLVKVWIPWTTPVPIGGLLATSINWRGMILSVFNLLLAALMYLPFVLLANKKAESENRPLTYSLMKFGERTPEEKALIYELKDSKKARKAEKRASQAEKRMERIRNKIDSKAEKGTDKFKKKKLQDEARMEKEETHKEKQKAKETKRLERKSAKEEKRKSNDDMKKK